MNYATKPRRTVKISEIQLPDAFEHVNVMHCMFEGPAMLPVKIAWEVVMERDEEGDILFLGDFH